jgi:uncharacterized beta-barrel protein YwiB (DUF1934 family)
MIDTNKKETKDDDVVIYKEEVDRKDENAIIKVKTISRGYEDDDVDETEIITKGIYRTKGSICQMLYQDSEATGFFNCETKITAFKGRSVSIMRRGDNVSSDLIVQCDKKLYSQYETPMVTMNVGILANQIDNQLDQNGGTLHMSYTIDINGSLVSENVVDISVELI